MAKNSSDFFTKDLREKSCKIYSEKIYLGGKPVGRWILWLFQNFLHHTSSSNENGQLGFWKIWSMLKTAAGHRVQGLVN